MGRLTPAQRAAIMARRELPEAETSVDLIEEMEIARLHNLTHVVRHYQTLFLIMKP